MDTTFRPSLISDAGRGRWLSPGLAMALHGAVAAAILVGLSFDPPPLDAEPHIVVELVAAAPPAPVEAPPAPPPPAPVPVAKPVAKPAPRIVPKAAAPLPRPLQSAPAPDIASPPSPEPAAEASAAASQPANGTPAAEAAPSTTPAPVQEAYMPPVGRAGYLSNPRPTYPTLARKRGWEGTVTLVVEVAADGSPLSVAVKQSSGHSVLDHCAVAAVRQWRFQPARRGGQAVVASVEVPIRFDLKDEGLS
ncbi:MAG: energy transducer TonB [Pseudomonadota bacterium]